MAAGENQWASVMLSVPQVPSLAFSFNRSLKNELPTAMVKTSSLEAVQGGRTQLQLVQSLDPRELLFDLSYESLEDHLQGCCVRLTQNLSMSNAFTLGVGGGGGGKHLSKKKRKARWFHLILLGPQWLWSEICLFQCSGFQWVPAAAAVSLAAAKSSLGSWGTREWK